MKIKYRVKCLRHRYDTLFTIDTIGTAISAAKMHSWLPCDMVEVTDEKNNKIEWRESNDKSDN
jgi:hypothetical protein